MSFLKYLIGVLLSASLSASLLAGLVDAQTRIEVARVELSPIEVDGQWEDWQSAPARQVDARNDASGAFDLREVKAVCGGTKLYLYLELEEPTNLQNGPADEGTLVLEIGSGEGAALRIDFRGRAAHVVQDDERQRVPWQQIDFICLPTYATPRYEMQIDVAHTPLADASELVVTFNGSDQLDEPMRIRCSNNTPQRVASDKQRHEIQRAPGTIRIASLNTEHQGLHDEERSAAVARLLHAVDADVYCFQEEWQVDSYIDAARKVFAGDTQPHLAWVNGSAIASRWPLTPIAVVGKRICGAVVHVPETGPVAVFSVHFECCGYAGSAQDDTRIAEAKLLVEQLQKFRRGDLFYRLRKYKDVPLVVAGDFNLVGSRTPLERLTSADLLNLKPLNLRNLGDGSTVTWRGPPQETFWPGRLDWLLYDSRLRANGFVFDTAQLSERVRRRLGVEPEDSLATDHRMLVADFLPPRSNPSDTGQ